jgi:hypothetical protein
VSAGNLFGFPSTSWWCSKTAHDYIHQWPVHSLQNTQNWWSLTVNKLEITLCKRKQQFKIQTTIYTQDFTIN